MDSGLRGLSDVFAGVVAEVAGAVVVCAKAELARRSEAIAAAAARDEMVIMEAPVEVEKDGKPRAGRMNRG